MKKLPLLFAISLGLRIGFAIIFQYDGLYGQDPFAYYEYTADLRAALTAGQPPPDFFWPIGYPLLAILASAVTGLQPLAGQAVSILAGSILAPLVYLIVLEIDPDARQGGFVGGLLVGTAAQLMLSSLSYMSDAAGLAWVTFSALAMLRYLRTERPRWLALAAFTLGWAIITRWLYGLVIIPWGLTVFIHWHQVKLSWSQRWQLLGLAVLAGGLVVAVQFLLTTGQDEIAFTGNLQVTEWNPANAFRRTVTYADGTFTYERPVGIFYAMPILHPAFVFPLLTPFLLIGLWSLRKRPPAQITLLLGWPLILYLFLIGTWENPRFSLSFFPPLAILTALGLQTLWNHLPTNHQPPATNHQPPTTNYQSKSTIHNSLFKIHYSLFNKYKPLLAIYLALALLGSLAWAGRDLRNFTTVNNAAITAVRWVEDRVPPQSTVITFGVSLTMQHRTGLAVSEIYNLTPDSLAELVENRHLLYLFLDLENINSQWQDLSPQENYRWLQANTELNEVDSYPPYTLFEVSAVP